MNCIAWFREAFDEISGKGGLEAGAIGNFVEWVGVALFGAPELARFYRDMAPWHGLCILGRRCWVNVLGRCLCSNQSIDEDKAGSVHRLKNALYARTPAAMMPRQL